MAEFRGKVVGVRHQPSAEPASLKGRRNRDVLDQQVIGPREGLDQPGEPIAEPREVDAMLAHRPFIVGLHRLGLAADQRHPLGVGRPRQVANGGSVRRDGLA